MTIEHVTDLDARALALLLYQFQDKPRLTGLLSAFADEFQALEDMHDQLLNERTIDGAEGEQLDLIGRIVGEGRSNLDDDAYRARIRTKIFVNRSNARHGEFLQALALFEGTDAEGLFELTEIFPAGLRLVQNGEPATSTTEITILLRRMKGAGIRLDYLYDTAAVDDMFTLGETDTYIATGSGGAINVATSITGPFTARTSGTAENIRAGIYVDGLFVVTGENGTVLTSDDTSTWTARGVGTFGATEDLYAIAHDGSQFVIVGGDGGSTPPRIYTSPDAITWTSRSSGLSDNGTLLALTWTGSIFVAVGVNQTTGNTLILTSSNGITWTEQTSGRAAGTLNDVSCSSSLIVAVGNTGKVLTSTAGTTWTSRTFGASVHLFGVEWVERVGLWVACGNSGTIKTSPDGVTWTARTSGSVTESLQAITATGNTIAVMSLTGWITQSGDAVTWELYDDPALGTSQYELFSVPLVPDASEGFGHAGSSSYGGELAGVVVI